MHIPDGVVDPAVMAGAGAASIVAVVWAGRQVRRGNPRWGLALAGAGAVLVGHLADVPLAGAHTGHLVGGTLLAVALGPAVAPRLRQDLSMTAPWLPDDFEHPLRVELPGGLHLRPISPDDLAIDMPAVMGNQAMLWSKYGEAWGWPPATMTAEEDREDLARHAREQDDHESFNYAILPADEAALFGCIYIDPADPVPAAAGPAAEVSFWTTADAPAGLEQTVREFVPAWLAREWPFVTVRYPFGEVG